MHCLCQNFKVLPLIQPCTHTQTHMTYMTTHLLITNIDTDIEPEKNKDAKNQISKTRQTNNSIIYSNSAINLNYNVNQS